MLLPPKIEMKLKPVRIWLIWPVGLLLGTIVVCTERTLDYRKFKPDPTISLTDFLNEWNNDVVSVTQATGVEPVQCQTVVTLKYPRSIFDIKSGPPQYFFSADGSLIGWVLESGE